MTKHIKSRVRKAPPRIRGDNSALGLFLGDSFDSLSVSGYSSLLQSPDAATGIAVTASIIGASTIQLMRNGKAGDVREKNELSRFIDVTPYSLSTRKTFVEWIVTQMLSTGNAFVLPVTQGGKLADLVPMPGASVNATADNSYQVLWKGNAFEPGEVLHFPFNIDPAQPWRGRGVTIQLRDVLQNLKQAAATTNRFMADKWKPSVIVKVDAMADEFSSEAGRKRLAEQYLSEDETGAPWIIPADLIDVQQVKPLTLADLAINETVDLDRKTVAAALGVPPFIIGAGAYNQPEYNNYIRRMVVPLATTIAQELTKKLLLSPEMYFKFSTRKLYSYTLTELADVGDAQYVRGLMSGNEVRDWLDLGPIDGLEELVMLENYIPADMIGNQKKLKGDSDDGNE